MGVLESYPLLRQLGEEILQLRAEDATRPKKDRPGANDMRKVRVGALGVVPMTTEQRDVIAYLYSAMVQSRNPAVAEDVILRAVGLQESRRRLSDVFRASDLWGMLVVRGKQPGTYMLDWPHDPKDDETDDVTREPWVED